MNPKRSSAQVGAAVAGFFMMAISTPCVLAMLNDLFIVGTDNSTGALIVGTFMGFVGIAGLAMMIFGLRKPQAEAIGPLDQQSQSSLQQAFSEVDPDADEPMSHDVEREVLKLARDHNGRLSVADIAVDTQLSVEESSRLMKYMVSCGVAEEHISQGGNIIYVFPGFATNKMAAVNPMDEMAMFDKELAASQDDVVFDRGMDGNVALDMGEDDEAEEVAAVQQQAKSEDW